MGRKILFLLLVLSGIWSCSSDDAKFNVDFPSGEWYSFRPVAGGAVMRYRLPDDDDVMGIKVRYTDAQGKEILCTGSYACDSLVLVGFNEARQGVPARITLCNRDNVESASIDVTFNTNNSGPVAFFEQLKVAPSWNGFMVTWDVPEQANGMAHVFYVGENPQTKEPDTLLVNSFVISAGADTLVCPLKQEGTSHDVVIRTEDFRGYMVKEEVYKDVEAYQTMKLGSEDIVFEDPEQLSIEDPAYNLGHEYLFDGDTKGLRYLLSEGNDNYHTYVAGPNSTGKPLFILDLKKPKMIAEVGIYALATVNKTFSYDGDYALVWRGGQIRDMLPCKFAVYGSNDKSSWKKLVDYGVDRETDVESRWCFRAYGSCGYWDYVLTSEAEVEAAEPVCLTFPLPADGKAYRYLKLEIEELFDGAKNEIPNSAQYTALHEFEVYVAKE